MTGISAGLVGEEHLRPVFHGSRSQRDLVRRRSSPRSAPGRRRSRSCARRAGPQRRVPDVAAALLAARAVGRGDVARRRAGRSGRPATAGWRPARSAEVAIADVDVPVGAFLVVLQAAVGVVHRRLALGEVVGARRRGPVPAGVAALAASRRRRRGRRTGAASACWLGVMARAEDRPASDRRRRPPGRPAPDRRCGSPSRCRSRGGCGARRKAIIASPSPACERAAKRSLAATWRVSAGQLGRRRRRQGQEAGLLQLPDVAGWRPAGVVVRARSMPRLMRQAAGLGPVLLLPLTT